MKFTTCIIIFAPCQLLLALPTLPSSNAATGGTVLPSYPKIEDFIQVDKRGDIVVRAESLKRALSADDNGGLLEFVGNSNPTDVKVVPGEGNDGVPPKADPGVVFEKRDVDVVPDEANPGVVIEKKGIHIHLGVYHGRRW